MGKEAKIQDQRIGVTCLSGFQSLPLHLQSKHSALESEVNKRPLREASGPGEPEQLSTPKQNRAGRCCGVPTYPKCVIFLEPLCPTQWGCSVTLSVTLARKDQAAVPAQRWLMAGDLLSSPNPSRVSSGPRQWCNICFFPSTTGTYLSSTFP